MKLWILLFAINATAYGVPGFNSIETAQSCAKEINVQIKTLPDGSLSITADELTMKCFVACLAKKAGWMTENGEIIRDKLLSKPISDYSENHKLAIARLHEKCVKIGENDCETADFIHRCLDAHEVSVKYQIEIRNACLKESNTTYQAYLDDRDGKTSNDPAVKCYNACIAKKKGWMTKNGDIIPDLILPLPLSEYSEKDRPMQVFILRRCVEIAKYASDDCETAYITLKCIKVLRGY